jgi:hypothetical protein
VTEVELERPDQTRSQVPAHSGLAAAPGPDRAGFYYLSWKGRRPGSTLVPVNLTSALESDLRERELLMPRDRPLPVRKATDLSDAVSEWSWLLAALALVFAVADVFWVTRGLRRPAVPLGAPPPPVRAAKEPA